MKVIECPRDAMQGIKKFIPTQQKIDYINQLLTVGFDTLDCGSFVSPHAIPQMRDTAEVFSQLDTTDTKTKLLAIVANTRGAKSACQFDVVDYIGFPLSLSETFQKLNTNKSVALAFDTLSEIQDICLKTRKVLVVYLSMGFGNPYGDPYNVDTVAQYVEKISSWEIKIISLADTIGVATPGDVSHLFSSLVKQFSNLELGVHLHSTPSTSKKKIEAAYKAGCNRFDGALKGLGGCPMSNNDLIGNMPTEAILEYLGTSNGKSTLTIDSQALSQALHMAEVVFDIS